MKSILLICYTYILFTKKYKIYYNKCKISKSGDVVCYISCDCIVMRSKDMDINILKEIF